MRTTRWSAVVAAQVRHTLARSKHWVDARAVGHAAAVAVAVVGVFKYIW